MVTHRTAELRETAAHAALWPALRAFAAEFVAAARPTLRPAALTARQVPRHLEGELSHTEGELSHTAGAALSTAPPHAMLGSHTETTMPTTAALSTTMIVGAADWRGVRSGQCRPQPR